MGRYIHEEQMTKTLRDRTSQEERRQSRSTDARRQDLTDENSKLNLGKSLQETTISKLGSPWPAVG